MSKRGTNGTNLILDERRLIDPARQWYVVLVEPGMDRAACADFVGRGIAIWLPHYRTRTIRRRRKAELSGLFFPGYVFAGIELGRSPAVLWGVRHVSDVLGTDGPLPVPAGVVQALADRLTGNVRSERLAVAAAFRVGEMRPIVQGPFQSFMAEITELLATGRVRGEVAIFGRKTSVEFDPGYLGAA